MRVAYLSRVACACGVKEKINVLGVVKYFTPMCQLLMHFLLALERFFDYLRHSVTDGEGFLQVCLGSGQAKGRA